jgi:formamidopyrimidine-DNA glycosylase
MPEMLEIEYYRQLSLEAVGRPITAVRVPDPHCLAAPLTVAALRRALVGSTLTGARRRGKLLLLDTPGPTMGLRFGMTGALVLDDRAAIERLRYGPRDRDNRWVRFALGFADGGALELHDARRFGRVVLDPDEEALGPDALSVTPAGLRAALATRDPARGAPLKARLQDQAHLAGIGNLLADEILWRASLSPVRPCGSLSGPELRRLHRHLRRTLDELLARGGSHLGDLMEERHPGGRCPRDGDELVHDTVGGRTTWWCHRHQR